MNRQRGILWLFALCLAAAGWGGESPPAAVSQPPGEPPTPTIAGPNLEEAAAGGVTDSGFRGVAIALRYEDSDLVSDVAQTQGDPDFAWRQGWHEAPYWGGRIGYVDHLGNLRVRLLTVEPGADNADWVIVAKDVLDFQLMDWYVAVRKRDRTLWYARGPLNTPLVLVGKSVEAYQLTELGLGMLNERGELSVFTGVAYPRPMAAHVQAFQLTHHGRLGLLDQSGTLWLSDAPSWPGGSFIAVRGNVQSFQLEREWVVVLDRDPARQLLVAKLEQVGQGADFAPVARGASLYHAELKLNDLSTPSALRVAVVTADQGLLVGETTQPPAVSWHVLKRRPRDIEWVRGKLAEVDDQGNLDITDVEAADQSGTRSTRIGTVRNFSINQEGWLAVERAVGEVSLIPPRLLPLPPPEGSASPTADPATRQPTPGPLRHDGWDFAGEALVSVPGQRATAFALSSIRPRWARRSVGNVVFEPATADRPGEDPTGPSMAAASVAPAPVEFLHDQPRLVIPGMLAERDDDGETSACEQGASALATTALTLIGFPAAAAVSSGYIRVFVTGSDGGIYFKRYDPATKSWGGWNSLGGSATSSPGAIAWESTITGIAYKGTDNAIWRRVWDPNTNAWTEPFSLGGSMTSAPALAGFDDYMVFVFARGSDNATLRYCVRDPATGVYSSWSALGGVSAASAPAAVRVGTKVNVFVTDPNGTIWRRVWDRNSGTWGSWGSIGGTFQGAPAAVGFSDGSIRVFARKSDGVIWRRKYTPGSGWDSWSALEGSKAGSGPSAVAFPSGEIKVFVRGWDNALWMNRKVPSAGWQGWVKLGCLGGSLSISGNVGVSGATISAGGLSTTSDANGNYTIKDLCPKDQYTVRVSKAGCSFNPKMDGTDAGSRLVKLANASKSGVNFYSACGLAKYGFPLGANPFANQFIMNFAYISVPGARRQELTRPVLSGDPYPYNSSCPQREPCFNQPPFSLPYEVYSKKDCWGYCQPFYSCMGDRCPVKSHPRGKLGSWQPGWCDYIDPSTPSCYAKKCSDGTICGYYGYRDNIRITHPYGEATLYNGTPPQPYCRIACGKSNDVTRITEEGPDMRDVFAGELTPDGWGIIPLVDDSPGGGFQVLVPPPFKLRQNLKDHKGNGFWVTYSPAIVDSPGALSDNSIWGGYGPQCLEGAIQCYWTKDAAQNISRFRVNVMPSGDVYVTISGYMTTNRYGINQNTRDVILDLQALDAAPGSVIYLNETLSEIIEILYTYDFNYGLNWDRVHLEGHSLGALDAIVLYNLGIGADLLTFSPPAVTPVQAMIARHGPVRHLSGQNDPISENATLCGVPGVCFGSCTDCKNKAVGFPLITKIDTGRGWINPLQPHDRCIYQCIHYGGHGCVDWPQRCKW